MTKNDDDNPHYDELIRELRELKKFIESNGEGEGIRRAPAIDANAESPAAVEPVDGRGERDPTPPLPADEAPQDEAPQDEAPQDEAPQDEAPQDDEPPTLREAVRRPARRDEMQLDLLSISRADHDSHVETAGDTEDDFEADPAVDEHADDVPPIVSAPVAGEVNDMGLAARASEDDDTGDDDGDFGARRENPGDDEAVIQFVLDLSDRILDTIEDKLLERSGELLPAEVRGELREAIGDILYEWCER